MEKIRIQDISSDDIAIGPLEYSSLRFRKVDTYGNSCKKIEFLGKYMRRSRSTRQHGFFKSGSTLGQVIAFCPTTPSRYLIERLLITQCEFE